MKPVILDTDTGVDDALAIILALRSPELAVKAITTVSGNVQVDLCVANVLRVLTLLRVPDRPAVARGCDHPLVKAPFGAPSVHGQDGLGDLEASFFGSIDRSPLVPAHAVDVMLSLIATAPEEITLIATGPLTNIATAIQRGPRTMRRVNEIVVMGGAVFVPGNIPPGAAEFNFFVDPHAGALVLGFGVPVTLVGLDVTHEVRLTRQLVGRELASVGSVSARFIARATEKYMDFYRDDQGYDGCYLHDPLAVGVAVDPSIVTTEEVRVYVETEGTMTAGMSLPFRHPTRDPGKVDPPNATVCRSVDADRFLRMFLERVR